MVFIMLQLAPELAVAHPLAAAAEPVGCRRRFMSRVNGTDTVLDTALRHAPYLVSKSDVNLNRVCVYALKPYRTV